MSSFPAPFLVPSPSQQENRVIRFPKAPEPPKSHIIRRRPNREQGRALEVLGRALEYLVDSRMFLSKEPKTKADGDAIHILSRCSREVFATCAEVVPVRQRMKVWFTQHLHLGGMAALDPSPGSKA